MDEERRTPPETAKRRTRHIRAAITKINKFINNLRVRSRAPRTALQPLSLELDYIPYIIFPSTQCRLHKIAQMNLKHVWTQFATGVLWATVIQK